MEQVFKNVFAPFTTHLKDKEVCANCGRELNELDKELARHIGGNDWCIYCYEQGIDDKDDLL
jgi:hypothetical protein